jgi:hypothetical protein
MCAPSPAWSARPDASPPIPQPFDQAKLFHRQVGAVPDETPISTPCMTPGLRPSMIAVIVVITTYVLLRRKSEIFLHTNVLAVGAALAVTDDW